MTESPVTRVTLVDQRLAHPTSVSHVEIRRITIEPSAIAGAHVHNGPVFGSIERGSAVLQVEGRPEVTLRPGDVFYEPADVVITKFDATDEGVTFLGYFLLGADQAPAIEFSG